MPQRFSGVHISDLTALFACVVQKILHSDALDSGEKGYYFALAHPLHWHDVARHIGAALKARGLIDSEEPKIWKSDEEAAEDLGIPAAFVGKLLNSG